MAGPWRQAVRVFLSSAEAEMIVVLTQQHRERETTSAGDGGQSDPVGRGNPAECFLPKGLWSLSLCRGTER